MSAREGRRSAHRVVSGLKRKFSDSQFVKRDGGRVKFGWQKCVLGEKEREKKDIFGPSGHRYDLPDLFLLLVRALLFFDLPSESRAT